MSALQFKNGRFKIMQIADIQEHATVHPDSIKLIARALDREKPDLVVFTGDQVAGYSLSFRRDTERRVRRTIADVLRPLEERGIPFCVTFGNHDSNCGISNAAQIPFYASHKGFVSGTQRGAGDPGTFSLEILNSSGKKAAFVLLMIDSGGKANDGSYEGMKRERIEWLRAERNRLAAECGENLPALLFQHIPVPEIYDVLRRVKKGTKGAVEAYLSRANQYYMLPAEAAAKGDFLGESPAPAEENTGEFQAIKEDGAILAAFFGHDHNNSFVLPLDGIDLGYTQGCGFNTYGPGAKRGVRIIELFENEPTRYETHTVTMEDLGAFESATPVKEFVLTHMPASIHTVIKAAKQAAIGAAVTGTLVSGAIVAAKLAGKGKRSL